MIYGRGCRHIVTDISNIMQWTIDEIHNKNLVQRFLGKGELANLPL